MNGSTPNDAAGTPATAAEPISLDAALSWVTNATEALAGWNAQETSASQNYVADGHKVIDCLDQLAREIYRVRGDLCAAIRRDEDERIVRADELLAEIRAELAARAITASAPGDQGPR